MKKSIGYFVFSLLIIMLSFMRVKADCNKYACLKCSYNVNNKLIIDYELESDGKDVSLKRTPETSWSSGNTQGSTIYKISYDEISQNNFFQNKGDNKTLTCLENIYIDYEAGRSTTVGVKIYNTQSSSCNGNSGKNCRQVVGLDQTSNNGLLVFEETAKTKSCTYNAVARRGNAGTTSFEVTVVSDGENIIGQYYGSYSAKPNETYPEIAKLFDVNKSGNEGCPNLYIYCDGYGENNYCSISLTDSQGHSSSGKTTKEAEELNKQNNNNNSNYEPNLDYDNFCQNDGIRKTMKILGYVIFIAKIVVPLIIIVLGMFDLAKAVVSDDEQAIKKASGAVVKRIAAGIIAFFTPTIIYAIINMFDSGVGLTGGIQNETHSQFGACTRCLLRVNDCGNESSNSNSNTELNIKLDMSICCDESNENYNRVKCENLYSESQCQNYHNNKIKRQQEINEICDENGPKYNRIQCETYGG